MDDQTHNLIKFVEILFKTIRKPAKTGAIMEKPSVAEKGLEMYVNG